MIQAGHDLRHAQRPQLSGAHGCQVVHSIPNSDIPAPPPHVAAAGHACGPAITRHQPGDRHICQRSDLRGCPHIPGVVVAQGSEATAAPRVHVPTLGQRKAVPSPGCDAFHRREGQDIDGVREPCLAAHQRSQLAVSAVTPLWYKTRSGGSYNVRLTFGPASSLTVKVAPRALIAIL